MKAISIGDWIGSGYIIMDASTGAAAYMISGGLNGGSCSGLVNLEAMLGVAMAALIIAQLLMNVVGLLVMAASLTVFAWIFVAFEIVMLVSVVMFLVDLLCDYIDYLNGNTDKGEEVINETVSFAVVTLIFESIGRKISDGWVLK